MDPESLILLQRHPECEFFSHSKLWTRFPLRKTIVEPVERVSSIQPIPACLVPVTARYISYTEVQNAFLIILTSWCFSLVIV